MKAVKKVLVAALALAMAACVFSGCTRQTGLHADLTLMENESIDKSLPRDGRDGWYTVFVDDFDRETLNDSTAIGQLRNADGTPGETITTDIWTYSPHDVRWETQTGSADQTSYWCPEMVTLRDGKVEIKAYETQNHTCDSCPKNGRFSGGIETRKINEDGSSTQLFSQAYGYFEATVKFPDADGLWSAFWLQSVNQNNPSHQGLDGTEIDVYESAFQRNRTWMGHALLWDGYGSFAKVDDAILDTGKDLYDGYHTFALKWTPEYYVWYVDGVATWASMGGGVAKVPEFLRLTVEMDAGDGWGPHGQKIGKFDSNAQPVFYVEQVKVMQNLNYQQYILEDGQFPYNVQENA